MKPDPKHRNLFNGDGNFIFQDNFFPPNVPETPNPAMLMHNYVDRLADNGIDTFIICVGGQMPCYPTKLKIGAPEYKRGDREFFRGYFPPTNDTDFPPEKLEKRMDDLARVMDRCVDLADAGFNGVVEMIKGCRNRGISPWASLRMNDGHGANNWDHCGFMNCPVQANPKFRLSGKRINPKDGSEYGWQLCNYEHREVRDYYFSLIKEVIEDLGVDALEIDWWRAPFCCETPASQKTTDMITNWHAEIREVARAHAKKTGKPFYLGIRAPARFGFLKSIGLDIKEMARRDLIDFFSTGNFCQANWEIPYDTLRAELGENVAIYGCIDASPNWLNVGPNESIASHRNMSFSAPLVRGNAASHLALGVDGIEQFNFFAAGNDPENEVKYYKVLQGLADLENLRGQPKQYALSTTYGWYMFPVFEYGEQIPAILEPEWRKAFRLSMCAEPTDKNLKLTIQVIVEKKGKLPELGVSFNGSWPNFEATATTELLFPTKHYSLVPSGHIALNYTCDVNLIKEGWNEIILYNENHNRATPEQRAANSVYVASIELSVA